MGPVANGLPEAAVAVVPVTTKLLIEWLLTSPTSTGEPVGCTATQNWPTVDGAKATGLNGSAVRAPVLGFTPNALSVLLPELITYSRALAGSYAIISVGEKLPPLPPLPTGKPGSTVNAPV